MERIDLKFDIHVYTPNGHLSYNLSCTPALQGSLFFCISKFCPYIIHGIFMERMECGGYKENMGRVYGECTEF